MNNRGERYVDNSALIAGALSTSTLRHSISETAVTEVAVHVTLRSY
jgi:hypothetical protein